MNRLVSLTFDDARPSQVDVGMKILAEYGLKATFYVNPENLSCRLEGWKKALAEGHEIGNHTLTHPCSGNYPWSRENALESYTLDRMEKELIDANRMIKEKLGVAPVTFAYPCGQTTVGKGSDARSYIPIVARSFMAGRAYIMEHLNHIASCDLHNLAALPLDHMTARDAIGRIENGEGGWVVFCGHEIAERGYQVTRMDELTVLCKWLSSHGEITTDTVMACVKAVLKERG